MNRTLVFFILSAILISCCVYVPLSRMQSILDSPKFSNEIAQDLHREAELVAYFCLSNPSMSNGEASVPASWEKALNSRINIRELSEAASESPDLKARLQEIKQLMAGGSLLGHNKEKGEFILVYRPKGPIQQYLIIGKSDMGKGDSGMPIASKNPLKASILYGLLGGLLMTLIARILFQK